MALFDSCRAMVNAGRSLGDEPFFICQLVRTACRRMALERAEQALAQGEPSEAALAALQRALESDESEPFFLRGCRGERATWDRFFEALRIRGGSSLALPAELLLLGI